VESAISRVLSWVIIHLGATSPSLSSNLPGSNADHANTPLFGLAPGGVYHAVECCHRRGALLPHPFTLTGRHLCRYSLRRSTLCCTFRGLTPPRGYLAPCPSEPGLSSTMDFQRKHTAAITWPTRARYYHFYYYYRSAEPGTTHSPDCDISRAVRYARFLRH